MMTSHLRCMEVLENTGRTPDIPSSCHDACSKLLSTFNGIFLRQCLYVPLEEVVKASEVWRSSEPMHRTIPPDLWCIQVETHISIVMSGSSIMLKPYGRTHRSRYGCIVQKERQYLLKEDQIVCNSNMLGQHVRHAEVVPYDFAPYISQKPSLG